MRILLVTSQFAPEVGGVPRLLWQFCAHRPAALELRVLSVRQQPPEFYAGFQAPFPVERVAPLPGAGLTSARLALRLWVALRRWRPDVVLCGVAYPTAIVVEAVTRLHPAPYVVYTHSEDATIRGAHKRAALGRALNRAARLIAVSEFTRRELARLGVDPARVTLIHPGIELERFADPPPLSATFASLSAGLADLADRWLLLTVGRLIWRKGQDTVIRALPRLAALTPNVHYLVVGSGPDEAGLRALAAELGVAGRVTFAGRIADEELPACYRACDAFVLPTRPSDDGSEVEGFGIVFLEAGAAGKPVVGGRAGGVADAVRDGETGLLVDPLDVEAVAGALQRLALDPALARRLGEAGRARVEREHSAQTFAARVAEVLEAALRPRSGQASSK